MQQQIPQQVQPSFQFQSFLVGHYSFITQFSLINPVRHIQLESFKENNELIHKLKQQKDRQYKAKEQSQLEESQFISQQIQQQQNNGTRQSQIIQTQNNLQTQNIQQNDGIEQEKQEIKEKQQKYQIEQIIQFKDKKYLPKVNKNLQQKIKKFLVSAGQDGAILFWNIEKQMKAYQRNYEEAQLYHQRKLQQPNKLKLDYVHQNPFEQLILKEQEMYKYGKYAPQPFEQGVSNNACNCIANTDDIIVAGFADGNIMQWNVLFEEKNGKTEIQYIVKQLFSHNDEVNCIDLLQLDERLLVASGSKDQSVIIQNFDSKKQCEKYQYHMDSSINQVQFLMKENYQEVYCLTDDQIAIMKLENRLNNDLDQPEISDFFMEIYQFPNRIISRFQLFDEKIFLLNKLDQCSELQIVKLHRDNNSNQTEDKIIYYYITEIANENINAIPQFQVKQDQNQRPQAQNQFNQNQNQQNDNHENNLHKQLEYVKTINHQKKIQIITQVRISQSTSWFHCDVDDKLYTFDEKYFIIFKISDLYNGLIEIKDKFEIGFKFDQIRFLENSNIVDQSDRFTQSQPYHTAIKTKYFNGTTWFLGGDLLGKYLFE